jgi:hypothetical protein
VEKLLLLLLDTAHCSRHGKFLIFLLFCFFASTPYTAYRPPRIPLYDLTSTCSEGLEGLSRGSLGNDRQHVETHSLGKRPALTHDDVVPDVKLESRRAVRGHVLVALLVTVVLLDVMPVEEEDNQISIHNTVSSNHHTLGMLQKQPRKC